MNTIDFDSIDSTSTYIKNNYKTLKDFTFVSASYQESGRGRMGRCWESSKGENLLFSLLLKDEELINKYSCVSILSGTVILSVLKDIYKIDNVSIKWPNDVYINDKKVCGILLEGVSVSKKIECIIVGIGINVNQKEFLNSNATSISLELKKDIDLNKFKLEIYKNLLQELEKLKNNNSNYLSIIRENNYLKGKEVYANINGERVLSKVIDINPDNSIKIIREGKEYNLYSDEITFHK